MEGTVLSNMGILYSEQNRMEEAMDKYDKAMKIHSQSGDARQKARILQNIGSIHFKQGRLTEAWNSYEEALNTLGEEYRDLEGGCLYANMGCVCFQKDDIEEAQRYYIKSYSVASEMELGIENFDGLIDLRQKMLSCGHTTDDLPWPSHWESYQAVSE